MASDSCIRRIMMFSQPYLSSGRVYGTVVFVVCNALGRKGKLFTRIISHAS